MAGKKKYIDSDVYTEAKKRIKHIIQIFDNLIVAFSGGKDSLVTLCLVDEVYKEMGITEKVKVLFRDEELIPDAVIDFVTEIAQSGKYDFRYYAIPLMSSKFILGETYDYIQWDRNREWLRQPPEFAITLDKDDNRVFDQYTADEYICQDLKGKVAVITGIRADESLIRLQAAINKRNENYINATDSKRIKICKPIYDWKETDVFLYLYKNHVKYCEIYDNQMWNGQNLRVSTPLHAESAKQFNKLKTLYPVFYQQLVDLFPEMIVQGMYWKDLDRRSIMYEYEHSFDGIRKYIDDNITDKGQHDLAIKRVNQCESMRMKRERNGTTGENYGGYPLLHVFKAVLAGQYKRVIQPTSKITKQEIQYELEGK